MSVLSILVLVDILDMTIGITRSDRLADKLRRGDKSSRVNDPANKEFGNG
jgi:hypothetical protein